MWPTASNYQKVSLRGVRVQLRVGAFAHERTEPQTVEVDVELYRRHDAYRGEGLDDCLNYDAVYRYVTVDWPARGHVDLLEAWAEDLVGHCMGDDRVDACRVRLRKAEIYSGTAVPEIEVVRHRDAAKRTAP
jgi:7,8-dihydroneopterin aldolase/epimerase/oxygenase